MSDKTSNDSYNESETVKRMNKALRWALNAPPETQREIAGKKKGAATKKRRATSRSNPK